MISHPQLWLCGSPGNYKYMGGLNVSCEYPADSLSNDLP
jgi:hypothetical protein